MALTTLPSRLLLRAGRTFFLSLALLAASATAQEYVPTIECRTALKTGKITFRAYTGTDGPAGHGFFHEITIPSESHNNILAGTSGPDKARIIAYYINSGQYPFSATVDGSEVTLNYTGGVQGYSSGIMVLTDKTNEWTKVQHEGNGRPRKYRTTYSVTGAPQGGMVTCGENFTSQIVSTTGKTLAQIHADLAGAFGEGTAGPGHFTLPQRQSFDRTFFFDLTDPGLDITVIQKEDYPVLACGSVSTEILAMDLGGTSFPITITGLGGQGPVRSLVWDAGTPDRILMGGDGYLAVADVAGHSAAAQVLTPAGSVVAISVDASGVVTFVDAPSAIRSFDPASGTISVVATASQLGLSAVTSGLLDPRTGDLLVGGPEGLFLRPAGSTGFQTVTLWSSAPASLTWDPESSGWLATHRSSNRVLRISPSGVMIDRIPQGAIPEPSVLAVDVNGDVLVGTALGDIYRIDAGEPAPTLTNSLTLPGTGVAGLTATGVLFQQFRLDATVDPSGLTLSFAGIPEGTVQGLTLVSGDLTPLGSGLDFFGFNFDATTFTILAAVPLPSPGNPFHWTYPATGFPASPLTVPPSSLPPNSQWDLIGGAIGSGTPLLTFTPVVRIVIP
jgi:hypothetical protein